MILTLIMMTMKKLNNCPLIDHEVIYDLTQEEKDRINAMLNEEIRREEYGYREYAAKHGYKALLEELNSEGDE